MRLITHTVVEKVKLDVVTDVSVRSGVSLLEKDKRLENQRNTQIHSSSDDEKLGRGGNKNAGRRQHFYLVLLTIVSFHFWEKTNE